MSALTICLKKIALAALWALTLALLVLSLGWMPLARATDLGKPLILVAKPELACARHGPLRPAPAMATENVSGAEPAGEGAQELAPPVRVDALCERAAMVRLHADVLQHARVELGE
jgi:hypothetical protein